MSNDEKIITLNISMINTIHHIMRYLKEQKWNIFFSLCFIHLFTSGIAFSEGIWFETMERVRLNDGSVSQELYLNTASSSSRNSIEGAMVSCQEMPSRWSQDYHKGIFVLKRTLDKQRQPVHVLKSNHSIRYEVKAISEFSTEEGTVTVLGAKMNLFLYGKRDFKPLERDHDFIERQDISFPLEINDENASSGYWIQTGQKCDLHVFFLGKPLANKTVMLFIKDSLCGEFITDEQGHVTVALPHPGRGVFRHTIDTCNYHLQVQHEYAGKKYISTLALLVHPTRQGQNRFFVGFYALLGTMAVSTAFVVMKRLKSDEDFY
jgi:hypothetical protein